MQTNTQQNTLESMAALEKGWDGYHTPPLSKTCIAAAWELKILLDRHYPETPYQIFPGAGGFVAFEFDKPDLCLWVYGKKNPQWAEGSLGDSDLVWKDKQSFLRDVRLFLTPVIL